MLKGLKGVFSSKPQVFQEWLQSSAKTAGGYTSGAFNAGSRFILTNFCGLECAFRHVDSWLWLSESAVFETWVAQVSKWFSATSKPWLSTPTPTLGPEAETQHLPWWSCRIMAQTWRANTSKFCSTPLMTLCSGHFQPDVTVFQNNSSAKSTVAALIIFFYVKPQRLRACSFPKYPARTFSAFTAWLEWMKSLPVWKVWWLILPPAS